MPLLERPVAGDNPQLELSLEQKQTIISRQIRRRLRNVITSFRQEYTSVLDLQQNNPFGLTPRQVRQALGADLQSFLDLNGKAQALFEFTDTLQ